MGTLIRSTLALLVLAALHGALLAPRALADADSEARIRYERAIELYESGVYDAALVELKRAYELKPSYKLLYNLAQVRMALHDHAGALDAYRQYLQQAGARLPRERREAVDAEVAQLSQRVAELTITTDVSGAEVLIDDLVVGTTPLGAPVLVNAGVRRVVIRHADHAPQSQRVSVAGGDRQVVELLLRGAVSADMARVSPAPPSAEQPAAAPSVEPGGSATQPGSDINATPDQQPPPARQGRLLTWIGWGVTAALVGGAVTTGVLALDSSAELKDKREHELVASSELERDKSRTTRLALVSDGLTAAALVAAGLSVWITVRGRRDAGENAPSSTASANHLKLGVGPTGLRLHARF
jgi:hypothetical protein